MNIKEIANSIIDPDKAFTSADFEVMNKMITDRGGTVEPGFWDELIGQKPTPDVLNMIMGKIMTASMSISDEKFADFNARRNPN